LNNKGNFNAFSGEPPPVDKRAANVVRCFSVPLRINAPKVIHEVFETEVVIVNLETGIYYSARGSGIEIWRALERGHSRAAIVGHFAPWPGGSEKADAFLEQLLREQLVVEKQNGETETAANISATSEFLPPQLDKFTDMQELLLLDPIHELDESGWPRKAPATSGG
jgi:hypothetical protein